MRHVAFESGKDSPIDAADLRQRLNAILRQLDDLSAASPSSAEPPTAQRVHSIIQARRRRDRFFDAILFADPAWDMLLELYAAELSGIRMPVSNLCIGAAVPATTALRWITTLEKRGIIRRVPDPLDGRRVFVSLSKEASDAMQSLLNACSPSEPLI